MPTPTAPDAKEVGDKLKNFIMKDRTGLQNMYGRTEAELNTSLEVPIQRGEEMAGKLIREMGCSYEIAKDLTVLTLYDVAILIDDSDSMIYEEGGARKKTLIQYVDSITKICAMAKESGILAMRFMNGPKGKRNWTGESSQEYLDQHKYGGVTRIGTELKRKILDLFMIGNPSQRKPLLVLIVIDGAVGGEKRGLLKKVIRDCVNERVGVGKGFEAVTFQFSRIGNDPGAAQLLVELGQDPDIEEYINVFPIDCDFEHQLGKNKWFVLPKVLLGAILPNWSRQGYHDFATPKDILANKGKGVEDADSGDDWEDW